MVIRILITIFALVVIAGTAEAQTVNYGNSYIGISGGMILPQSNSFKFSGTVLEDVGGTLFHTGSGTVSYNSGPAASLSYGYNLSSSLALEGSLEYASYGFHSADLNFTADAEGLTDSGTVKLNGHVTTYLGMANAIVTPWRGYGLRPYLGIGAGVAIMRGSTANADPGRDDDGVSQLAAPHATVPAFNGILGLDYSLMDRLTIGARYRFLWMGGSNTHTAGGFESIAGSAKLDPTMAHVFSVQATYRF